MNAPADKPGLPEPDALVDCAQGFCPMYSDSTVRRLLAEERRKALEEAIAACSAVAACADRYCSLTNDDDHNEGRKDGADESADAIRAILDDKENHE